MDKTLVLIDAGFLSKLSRYLGNGKYLKYDIIQFSKKLAEKQKLDCQHIFYYIAPPFQSENPSEEETKRFKNYEKFKNNLSNNPLISIREGRCQRLKIDGKFIYGQKGVDALLIIDLMSVPIKYKEIKKVILIANDSDFVPVVKSLKEIGIEIVLYTHYSKKRESSFSRSNELLKSVYKYIQLTKKDFEDCSLNIKYVSKI